VSEALKPRRRTQAERTAETKRALIDATVRAVHRLGYAGATTAAIADEAGISRGSILHQFGTRAELMAQVVSHVFEYELQEYDRLMREMQIGTRVSDWVELGWRVMNQPPSRAVLEILLATRSDPQLAERVLPMQARVEQSALERNIARFGNDKGVALTRMRVTVWTIRGLTIAPMFCREPPSVEDSVALYRSWLRAAEDAGVALTDGPGGRA